MVIINMYLSMPSLKQVNNIFCSSMELEPKLQKRVLYMETSMSVCVFNSPQNLTLMSVLIQFTPVNLTSVSVCSWIQAELSPLHSSAPPRREYGT